MLNRGPESKKNESTKTDEGDLQAWSISYSACMQEEGIKYPDPPSDPSQGAAALDIESLGGMDAFSAADGVCRGKLGDPPMAKGPKRNMPNEEEMFKNNLELAKCLREQGVDVEDPTRGSMLDLPQGISPDLFEKCGSGSITMSTAE
ncbi:hypothetical protein G7068_01180 [Leucobacter viscericola]|uniref:Uncharacterized protein n=1 Tax=Leucobacter viscericola TaxID=2714935 RepID=A0A6G7XBN8_9MICO|nr:hypothetical protein [Leucobacter viscericola]QIK61973.1 hypothetical protein G7068_01180 [Leucobacter viscericola]